MIVDHLRIGVILGSLLLLAIQDCAAQKLGREFRADYTLTDLGRVEGLPVRQGGLVLLDGHDDTLLIGGLANEADGKLYSVKLTRDDQNNIVAFAAAKYFADAPFNDGGLCYAPNGALLCAQWPVNNLGQLKPGSREADRVVDLGRRSEQHSLASLNLFMPSGRLKLLTWSSGRWFDAKLNLLSDGTYELLNVKQITTLVGGPEGFVYVPTGSPQFPKPSILVAEWSAGNIVAYEITNVGDPIPNTRRVFVSRLTGAEGGMIDPLTGDYLFTTFGGGDRVIKVDGLKIPLHRGRPHYSLYPEPRVLKIREAAADPKPTEEKEE